MLYNLDAKKREKFLFAKQKISYNFVQFLHHHKNQERTANNGTLLT